MENITCKSQAMKDLIKHAEALANSDVAVLVQGETGTGKNRMAEFIHYHSQRRNGLFLRIDCAEFNRSLIESELFGHEKGAFTGATEKKAGYLELVCGGTLFLDEIENPDHELQVKLLRVVEEKKFRRVGGREDIATDFRVISATNVDIEQLVQSGRFRKDLYFRLKGAELKIPPLRERREDIPIFIDYFLKEFGPRYGRQISISLEAMACLKAFQWTGNIRELRQVLEAMIATAASTNINRIEFKHPKNEAEIKKALDSQLGQLVLDVTEWCNMSCKYCIYSGHYQYVRTHRPRFMSFDTAKKAIDFYLQQQNCSVSIPFSSGQ
jgi:two-component system response regulator HydG